MFLSAQVFYKLQSSYTFCWEKTPIFSSYIHCPNFSRLVINPWIVIGENLMGNAVSQSTSDVLYKIILQNMPKGFVITRRKYLKQYVSFLIFVLCPLILTESCSRHLSFMWPSHAAACQPLCEGCRVSQIVQPNPIRYMHGWWPEA